MGKKLFRLFLVAIDQVIFTITACPGVALISIYITFNNYWTQTRVLTRLVTKALESQMFWHKENYQLGIDLGYPKCCVKQFCAESPDIINSNLYYMDIQDNLRFKAAQVNGVFTGFVPCYKCAEKVLSGKVKLHELIKNRKITYGNFDPSNNNDIFIFNHG